MASSLNELNKSLLKQLECPVCLETCTPPIRMCVRSHIVCSECATGLAECATCRQPMAAERSWFAENICLKVKFPCKHAGNGCHETFDLSKLNDHLPDCTFKNYDCLIGANLVNGSLKNVCEWKGPEYELYDHVEKTHGKMFCIPNSRDRWVKNVPLFNGNIRPTILLTSAHDSLFWHILWFWPTNKEIEFSIIYIGSKEKSSTFQYKCDLGLGDGTGGKLSFHSNTIPCSLDERINKTLKIGEGIRGFLNSSDGKLGYSTTILKKYLKEWKQTYKPNVP